MKTITTSVGFEMRRGDFFTLPGVFVPDRRWWPRLRNWALRRPPPMTNELQRFRVTSVIGGNATLEQDE